MTRANERIHFDDKTRIALLETDLDGMDLRLAETNDRLAKILWALIGLLISVTTASILLAINLVVKS